MFYTTGIGDTIDDVKEQANFQGSVFEFQEKLQQQNPRLRISPDGTIPPFTPIIFLEQSQPQPELRAFVSELYQSDPKDREVLRQFQESSIDIPRLVALNTIMEEVQAYAHQFRDFFKQPLISTPWITTDVIKRTSLLKLLREGSNIAAGSIHRRNHVFALDELYHAFCTRDVVNREIYLLQKESRLINAPEIKRLKELSKAQTATIKRLLPKKLDATLTKFLNKKGLDVLRARANSYSMKMARTGNTTILKLDYLNGSGLRQAKKMIERFEKVGSTLKKASAYLGPAFVVYDTVKAYQDKKDWGRTFVGGSAAVGTGMAMGALASATEWGALTLGIIAGDAALGGAIIASSPVWGTALVVVIGVAVTGFVAYKAKGFVEELWDSDLRKNLGHEIDIKLDNVWKAIQSAWDQGYHWVFYGSPGKYQTTGG